MIDVLSGRLAAPSRVPRDDSPILDSPDGPQAMTALREWLDSRAGRLVQWLAVHAAVGALAVAAVLLVAQLTLHLLVVAYVDIAPYQGIG